MIEAARMTTLGVFVLVLGLASSGPAHAGARNTPPPTCSGGALGANEARVYTQTNRGGTCYSLLINADGLGDNWTSWEATFGFPNDVIRSAEAGPGVDLSLFWNSFYTKDNGAPLVIRAATFSPDLGSWKGQASAARLQQFIANSCTGASGKLVIFTDPSFSGDCTELPSQIRCYRDAVDMGFRNDVLTSVINTSAFGGQFFAASNWGGSDLIVGAHSSLANLSSFSFNDIMSSAKGTIGAPCF